MFHPNRGVSDLTHQAFGGDVLRRKLRSFPFLVQLSQWALLHIFSSFQRIGAVRIYKGDLRR